MDYFAHLARDKKFKKLLGQQEPFRLNKRKHTHLHLCGSIMGQQLSTKVAATLRKRFLGLYDGRTPMPEDILSTPFETLRAIGLSNAKTNYVHNVAGLLWIRGWTPAS